MTHVLRTTGLTCAPDAQIPHVANQLARWQGLGSQWMACRPSPFGTPSSDPDLLVFVYVCERSVVPVDGGSSRTCVVWREQGHR